MPEGMAPQPEGLSEEENQKAADIYAQHGRASAELDHAKGTLQREEAALESAKKKSTWVRSEVLDGAYEARQDADRAQDSYDVSRWRGEEALKKNPAGYEEQAKLDAEADGKAIHLDGEGSKEA